MIYFFVTKDEAHVKIGTARDVEKRRLDLASAHPTNDALRCVFTMPGSYRVEHALHLRFDHLCTRGEWFRYDEEIKQWIAKAERAAALPLASTDAVFEEGPLPAVPKRRGDSITEFGFRSEVSPRISKRISADATGIEVFVRGLDPHGDPYVGKEPLASGLFAPRRVTIQMCDGLSVEDIRCGAFVQAIGDELPKYAAGVNVVWPPIGAKDSFEFTVRNASDQPLNFSIRFAGIYRKDVFAWKR